MYPLRALLVGCADVVLPHLRRELSTLAVGIEGEFLDSRSCLAHVLATPRENRLIIIQSSSTAETVQLERLNEAAAGIPILSLVDPGADPSLMVRAMRAGAAQVVRLPLQPDDFGAAMHRIAIQFGHPPGQCRTITVLGASEGCGATSIALNLASEIGRLRNAPCILAEEAISFGRLAHYLSIEPQLTIADLLREFELLDTERVRRSLTKVEENLQVLVGSYRAITPVRLTTENVLKLLGCVKQLADVVVIDGRYSYDELDFDFLAQSQQILLVVKPTIPSLHNLKMLLTHLAERECLAQQFVVINQFDQKVQEFSARRLSEVLAVPKVFTVAADVEGIRIAENCGQTLRKAAPHSHALDDITRLAHVVLGLDSDSPSTDRSIRAALNRVAHLLHLN